MERWSNLGSLLFALVPSVLLLTADFAIGDYQLFEFLNKSLVSSVLDFACAYVSPVLFSVFYISTLVALFLSVKAMSKATGIVSLMNGILSYGLGSLVKMLVQRPRPELLAAARVISEARIIGFWHISPFSFPSTTTMLAFGLTLPIFLEKRRIGSVLVALSYFLGFAVIYTGFHFPLDVAGGALLSFATTLCTGWMRKPLARRLDEYASRNSGKAG